MLVSTVLMLANTDLMLASTILMLANNVLILANTVLILVYTVLMVFYIVLTSANTVFDDCEQCFDLSEHCNASEFILEMMTHCVDTWYPIPNILRNLAEPTSLSQTNTLLHCIDRNINLSTLCCKCLRSFACFYCKMSMFQRAGMREGSLSH